MTEKRFECDSQDVQFSMVEDGELILANPTYVVNLLNSLQEEIAYWKHRVSSLLWILGQFDEQKVKKLLEELDEREKI